jgi:subtilase family serine protease
VYTVESTASYQNPLAGGAERTVTSLVVDVPQGIPSGDYYVRAVADSMYYVSENDETNNARDSDTAVVI